MKSVTIGIAVFIFLLGFIAQWFFNHVPLATLLVNVPVIIQAAIAIAILSTLRIYAKNFRKNHPKLADESDEDYSKRHGFRIFISYVVIMGPVYEEIVFRLPLLYLFSEINDLAIVVIYVQAVIFGILHYADTLNDKMFRSASNPLWGKLGPIVRGIASFILAVALGYIAVNTQNIFICIALHSLWNLIVASIIVILITFVILPVFMKKAEKDYMIEEVYQQLQEVYEKKPGNPFRYIHFVNLFNKLIGFKHKHKSVLTGLGISDQSLADMAKNISLQEAKILLNDLFERMAQEHESPEYRYQRIDKIIEMQQFGKFNYDELGVSLDWLKEKKAEGFVLAAHRELDNLRKRHGGRFYEPSMSKKQILEFVSKSGLSFAEVAIDNKEVDELDLKRKSQWVNSKYRGFKKKHPEPHEVYDLRDTIAKWGNKPSDFGIPDNFKNEFGL